MSTNPFISKHKPILPTLSQKNKGQMIWLGLFLFIAHILLTIIFSWHSIDSFSNQLTNLQADAYINSQKNNPDQPNKKNKQNTVVTDWKDIPENLKENLNYDEIIPDITYETIVDLDNGEVSYIYLLLRKDNNLGDLFFISHYSDSEIIQFTDRFITTAIKGAFWLSLIIFTFLFFIFRWLINKTSEPIQQLSLWSESLKPGVQTVNQSSFSIQEINRIAQRICENMNSIESYNRREQSFLKHASHELRTPLAIIQASLDTLQLKDTKNPSVNRALRASQNMRRIITSLLWIARESKKNIKIEKIDLRKTLHEIIQNLNYIVNKKKLKLDLNVSHESIYIESELLIIVITNLIRNAFEHNNEGTIKIKLNAKLITISNEFFDYPENANFAKNTNNGFGLGLALTRKICTKFNWDFQFHQTTNSAIAIVKW